MVFRSRAVGSVALNRAFWRGRRVFVTGHTGFKGSWLTEWLTVLGARVTGFALDDHDVRDARDVRDMMIAAAPEIVLHLAAQALVRPSYADPVTTFATNVMGTVHVLDALQAVPSVRVAVLVTSDKCYANDGATHPFRETDRLGGSDPYSSSKACAELAIAAFRDAYFRRPDASRIVSVRAGNVIGGGDWSADRLVPDLVRAFREGRAARIRYPDATRPWQFVLDALHGYLRAAECAFERGDLPGAFNFGPDEHEARPVRWLADTFAQQWGNGASWYVPDEMHPHEAATLALDSSRARELLGWAPLLNAEAAVAWTVEWYKSKDDRRSEQIERFMEKMHR